MSQDMNLFGILVLAALAAFIAYQFWKILGRRTGNERARPNPYLPRERVERSAPVDGKVVTLPRAPAAERAEPANLARIAPEGSPLHQALSEIQRADRTFDPAEFLEGARGAYELIIGAFSEGDKSALKPLLGRDVYEDFASAIDARLAAGETLETSFVGLAEAKIVSAAISNRVAEITVRFVCELIRCRRNADGAVLEGDPTAVQRVTDVWTFARDTRSSDPNWELVGTASE